MQPLQMNVSSLQEDINTLKSCKKLTHCIGISIISLTSTVAAVPIILSIIKIKEYGGYIIIGIGSIYLICILIIIAKWIIIVSEYNMRINKKINTMRHMRLNPIFQV
jgi:hypothetical protein